MAGPWLGQWPGELLGDLDGARQPAAPGTMYANIGGGGGISADLTIASADVIAIGAGPRKKPYKFPQWEPAPGRLPATAARRRDDEVALLLIGGL